MLPQREMTRRRFLRTSAAVAGASVMAPAIFRTAGLAAAEKGWPMRLVASTVEFATLPVEKAVERIAALGFEAVDLWPNDPGREYGARHMDEVESRLGAAGVKDLLAKHNLKLGAVTCYWVGYPKYAKLLGQLGGGVAVCEAYHSKAASLTAEVRAFFEQLKPQIELAEKYNSYLAIENHPDRLLNSRDSFKAFVEMNRSSRVGIALAPHHLQAAGISVEEIIATVGKQLLFFYAWQNGEGTSQLPGIGPTDCVPWIAALAEVGYRGYVNPFMHHCPSPDETAAALAASRDYLQKCYAKAVPA